MNIIDDAVGQTCNRFFEWLYYLNEAIVKGEKLVILIPDRTIEDYPNLLHSKYVSFPLYFRILTKILGIKRNFSFIRRFRHLFFNSKLQRIYSSLFDHLHFYKSLSKFPYHGDFSAIRPKLQYIFTLRRDLRHYVDPYFDTIDRDNFIVVGVHIRWGDYRTWLGGKYFFELEVYNNYMVAIQKLFTYRHKHVKFFISCNEPIDINGLKGLSTPPHNHKKCDCNTRPVCIVPMQLYNRNNIYFFDLGKSCA